MGEKNKIVHIVHMALANAAMALEIQFFNMALHSPFSEARHIVIDEKRDHLSTFQ
ncbi:hypothetical protein PspKH34_03070 [Parageobacillus sp. KH3-4]|nr:hypothetical protein PspKH34_03070 [Parageobacillus sp. KH3-4]